MKMICYLCNSKNIYKKFSLEELEVLQCRECGLAFLSHIPEEEELKGFYSLDYYRERGEYYCSNIIVDPDKGIRDENIESFSRGLDKLNSLKPDKGRLLDIGCGLGVFLNMAKTDGWEVWGADISPDAARYAREKFHLDVRNSGDLEKAGFSPGSFDAITLWDSLEHLPDPLGQLRLIHSLLKEDGLIMLDTPNETSLLRKIARFLYVMTGGGFNYPARKLYHCFHLYYFGPLTVEILLKMGGFELSLMEKKAIPIVKARGSSLEKGVVRFLSYLEKALGMEYEMFVIAKKRRYPRSRGEEKG